MHHEPHRISQQRFTETARRFGLTDREAEVLHQVAGGATNGEVAQALHLSDRTVQRHLERIFDKVGVRTRAGAVGAVMGEGTAADDDAPRGGRPEAV